MILKYLSNDVWGYIDNVRQVGVKCIDAYELIKQHDKEVKDGSREDIASKNVSSSLIANSNKVFLLATEGIDTDDLGECHQENLLDNFKVDDNYPAYSLILYLNDHKEYETLILVTNQKAYLLNDKGENIERLA